jgi:hypothetical protein
MRMPKLINGIMEKTGPTGFKPDRKTFRDASK